MTDRRLKIKILVTFDTENNVFDIFCPVSSMERPCFACLIVVQHPLGCKKANKIKLAWKDWESRNSWPLQENPFGWSRHTRSENPIHTRFARVLFQCAQTIRKHTNT